LTGSAVPADNVTAHTGTGRFSRMLMRPMSLFESLCTRDIRVYAQAIDGDVFHYRDKSGLESDLIVRLRDGRWAAIEVKLGNKQIEEAAQNLLALKAKIDEDKMGQVSFLMVITGGQYAYRRKDGVLVVPIGCLKN
jgi:hypothetical protein